MLLRKKAKEETKEKTACILNYTGAAFNCYSSLGEVVRVLPEEKVIPKPSESRFIVVDKRSYHLLEEMGRETWDLAILCRPGLGHKNVVVSQIWTVDGNIRIMPIVDFNNSVTVNFNNKTTASA